MSPAGDAEVAMLGPVLTAEEVTFEHGAGRRGSRGSPRTATLVRNYLHDPAQDCLVFPAGFSSRVYRVLRSAGYTVELEDDRTPQERARRTPNWAHFLEHCGHVNFRESQRPMIEKLLSRDYGVADCVPGFGKSFLFGCICLLLPGAKIDIATKRASVATERLFPEVRDLVPSCGLVTGKTKKPGPRVTVYTLGCLQHAAADADVLLVDEVHEVAADSYIPKVLRYARAARYGFTASPDRRGDQKDYRVEGLFGPTVFKVGYAEAVAADLVVPIEVRWTEVNADRDLIGATTGPTRRRLGVWTNPVRNAAIAADARRYGDEVQTLITVSTIEHALHLRSLLPGFELVYAEGGLSPRSRRRYVDAGLMRPDEPEMTAKRRASLARRFEQGELKKAIATTVWNVGVSFNALEVLIRGDGGRSGINSIQVPGRVSRTSDGKRLGVVHEYTDRFHSFFLGHARERSRQYGDYGFSQVFPGGRDRP